MTRIAAAKPEAGAPRAPAEGDFALIGRLLRNYIGPRKTQLVFALLCMAGGAATTGVLAWVLDPAIKLIFFEKRADMLLLIPLAVIGVVFLRGIFNYGDSTFTNSIGQGIIADTQRDMFRSLVASDLKTQNAVHSGQFVSNFLYDATML